MLLLQNITIIDPLSPFNGQKKDILIDNQQIIKIDEPFSLSCEETLVKEDLCISPGWVDMQVHLSDPGFEQKETLTQLAQAGQSGGFTHLVCYPNTQPFVDNVQVLNALQKRANDLPIHLHFTGCLTHHSEGKDFADVYEMYDAGAIAFTDGTTAVQSAGMGMRLRQYMQPFQPLMITSLQEKSLAVEGMMNEGTAASYLGMKGIPEMAEVVALSRELALHEYAALRTHFQPVTSPKALEMLEIAKQKYPEISVGIAIPYLVLKDEDLHDFDTNLKIFPPLRAKHQVEQLVQALKNKTIDVLTSAHWAQGLEEKDCEFDVAEAGMINLQTVFALANEFLVQNQTLTLQHLIELMSINPRKILGLPNAIVQENAKLDFTLFEPHQTWTLEAKDIPSRAKNSPFIGKTLNGKVLGVLFNRKP